MRGGLSLRETSRRIAQVYVEQAPFLLAVAVVLFIPVGLVDALASPLAELETEEAPSAWEIVRLLFGVALHVATATFGEVFYAGIAMAAVTQSMEGKPRAPIGQLLRTLPYGRLLVVDVISSVALGIGLALLIVPGLWLFARYVLAAPLLKLEAPSVRGAFRRSRELSRGHGWFLLVLLGGVYAVSELAIGALQAGGIEALGESLLSDWAIAEVIGVLVTPVWAVALCVVTWRLIHHERQSPRPPVPVR
jgi:hypothetical protein